MWRRLRYNQPTGAFTVPQVVDPVGTGSSPTYGGDMGVSDVYIARLAARLNRFKYYPIDSLRNGEIGVTVLLTLVINRRGQCARFDDFFEFRF